MVRFPSIVLAMSVVALLTDVAWYVGYVQGNSGSALTPSIPAVLILLAGSVTFCFFVAVMVYERHRYDKDEFSRHGR